MDAYICACVCMCVCLCTVLITRDHTGHTECSNATEAI